MKRLNTDSITNELERSSFFPSRPASEREEAPTPPAVRREPSEKAKPTVIRPVVKSEPVAPKAVAAPVAPAVPTAAPAGRRYVRRTFDFYEDQIAYLTKVSLEDRLAGKESSMNAM